MLVIKLRFEGVGWVREEPIQSRFIYFHSYCLEPVSPIKKLGEGAV